MSPWVSELRLQPSWGGGWGSSTPGPPRAHLSLRPSPGDLKPIHHLVDECRLGLVDLSLECVGGLQLRLAQTRDIISAQTLEPSAPSPPALVAGSVPPPDCASSWLRLALWSSRCVCCISRRNRVIGSTASQLLLILALLTTELRPLNYIRTLTCMWPSDVPGCKYTKSSFGDYVHLYLPR